MLRRTDKNRESDAKPLGAGAFALLISLVFLAVSFAHAQLSSNIAGVNLAANLNTSLTVTATPGTVNFALVPNGTVIGSSAITVNTTWNLRPSIGAVTTYAYFTAAAAALTDGTGNNIPSAKLSGSVNGGAFTAFTGTSPFAGGSSLLLSRTLILGFNRRGNHTDTLNVSISTTGLVLPAGNYTGLLHIQAQAF